MITIKPHLKLLGLTFKFYFFFLSILFSQSFTIKGTIADSLSNDKLVGANVYIEGTGFGTSTDGNGYYQITNIKHGKYNKSNLVGEGDSGKKIAEILSTFRPNIQKKISYL